MEFFEIPSGLDIIGLSNFPKISIPPQFIKMFVKIKNGNKVGKTDFINKSVPFITESIDDFGKIIKQVMSIVIMNVVMAFILDFSEI